MCRAIFKAPSGRPRSHMSPCRPHSLPVRPRSPAPTRTTGRRRPRSVRQHGRSGKDPRRCRPNRRLIDGFVDSQQVEPRTDLLVQKLVDHEVVGDDRAERVDIAVLESPGVTGQQLFDSAGAVEVASLSEPRSSHPARPPTTSATIATRTNPTGRRCASFDSSSTSDGGSVVSVAVIAHPFPLTRHRVARQARVVISTVCLGSTPLQEPKVPVISHSSCVATVESR